MNLGDVDVVVELIVSKRKKKTCDRNEFTAKAGNKKIAGKKELFPYFILNFISIFLSLLNS